MTLFRKKQKEGDEMDLMLIQGYLILDQLSEANERWKKGHEALKETVDKMVETVKGDQDDD